jgi:hypothetical protein
MKQHPGKPQYRIGATRLTARGAEGCGVDCVDDACIVPTHSADAKDTRPRCLCKHPNPPMYLSTCAGRFFIKRMPGTGYLHHPNCLHYQPPAEPPFYAGSGANSRRAVENPVILKLAFHLNKRPSQPGPSAASDCPRKNAVRPAAPQGISLMALLKLIWHSAELDRWHPAFAGRRHWWTVRNRLRAAARRIQVNRVPLLDRLYIPEAFRLDQNLAIANRQRAFLRPFRAGRRDGRELVLMIAEIKSITPAHYGFRLACKHAPQLAVFIDQKALKALRKRYASLLALHQAQPQSHLMMIATAGVTLQNAVCIEQSALMLVTRHWLPCETDAEARLLDALVLGRRRFFMNFDPGHSDGPTGQDEGIVTLMLTDTRPPTALLIADRFAHRTPEQAIAACASQTGLPCRIWQPIDEIWPDLPPIGSGGDPA